MYFWLTSEENLEGDTNNSACTTTIDVKSASSVPSETEEYLRVTKKR